MLIESEEEPKVGDINPDALEAVFEEGDIAIEIEEEITVFTEGDEDDVDEIDIAFQANDEGYW